MVDGFKSTDNITEGKIFLSVVNCSGVKELKYVKGKRRKEKELKGGATSQAYFNSKAPVGAIMDCGVRDVIGVKDKVVAIRSYLPVL